MLVSRIAQSVHILALSRLATTSHFEMTYLQSLDKALDLFIEFKFCESDFYFMNGSKNCMEATYNFCSVYAAIDKI